MSDLLKLRVFGMTETNPQGIPEDPRRCIVEMIDSSRRLMRKYQCEKGRGHGPDKLYCAFHARSLPKPESRS